MPDYGEKHFGELAGPFGPVHEAQRVDTYGWLPPDCHIFSSALGMPPFAMDGTSPVAKGVTGTGHSVGDPERARFLAICEALERYAMLTPDPSRFARATAKELGSAALDLHLVPQCSAAELRTNGCPVYAADATQEIRWIPGVDLIRDRPALLPAVMVHMGLELEPPERFWTPVSTGCAVHTTPAAALANAICEVIERDAIAVAWLQRLPLPRLAPEVLGEDALSILSWCRPRGIEVYLFDATTDVGVPVVYCLLLADGAIAVTGAQLVGCACDPEPSRAAVRALLEAMSIRGGVQERTSRPRRYADFTTLADGAAVMALRGRRRAFGFLTERYAGRAASFPRALDQRCADGHFFLEFLTRKLAALGMSLFAADITTRELDEVGLTAVRALVPELQPLPTRALAQYRAHPRLYSAPTAMGMRVLPTTRLNPFPQPMA